MCALGMTCLDDLGQVQLEFMIGTRKLGTISTCLACKLYQYLLILNIKVHIPESLHLHKFSLFPLGFENIPNDIALNLYLKSKILGLHILNNDVLHVPRSFKVNSDF